MGLLLLDGADIVTTSATSGYASMMRALLPPGKLWRAVGALLDAIFLGCADELSRVDARVANLLDEDDPTTATELLPEYERELGVTAAVSLAERRANIVARLVARQRFRPVDFQQALAPLLDQNAADVVIIERTRAQVVAMGDDREIFRFFVYRNPSLPGTYFLASAQAQVMKMKPSHTIGTVIESVTFTVDDPHSIADRDLVGA
jgi:hypothetical protein